MTRLNATVCCLLVCLSAFFSVGCCDPIPFNVRVSVDDSLKNQTIYVDLVALNPTTGEQLAAKDMNEYWKPGGDALRNSLDVYQMTFVKDDNAPRTLSEEDPKWQEWAKDFSDLYIMARLPGSFKPKPGQPDPRRIMLPLAKCRWEDDTIEIVIKPGLITYTSTLLPADD